MLPILKSKCHLFARLIFDPIDPNFSINWRPLLFRHTRLTPLSAGLLAFITETLHLTLFNRAQFRHVPVFIYHHTVYIRTRIQKEKSLYCKNLFHSITFIRPRLLLGNILDSFTEVLPIRRTMYQA